MKRKHIFEALILLVLQLCLVGYAQNVAPQVRIEKFTLEPSPLHPRIILSTDGALRVVGTSYALDAPSTILVEMEGASAVQEPPAVADEPLVTSIKAEPKENNALRLLIALREKVPYRIFAGPSQTVIELNKVLNPALPIASDPEFEQALAGRTKDRITLRRIEILESAGRVDFHARSTAVGLYNVFALADPLRLVVDLYDTIYSDPTSVYPVEKYGVERLKVGQFKVSDPAAITRLVFEIKEPKFYSIVTGTEGLTVSFASDQAAPMVGAALPPAQESIVPPPPPAETEKAPPVVQEKPAETPPVKAEAAKGPQTLLAADQFVPKTITAAEPKYTGDEISVKVKDADLRDVVLYLGEFAGLNVIFDPDVKGRVTCNFEAVPWDQILDVILKANKMGKSLEGTVLRIAPVQILSREDEEERRLRESKEEAGPLVTRAVTLSYSRATDVRSLLEAKKSQRGQIVTDNRTNTLIISEVRDRMEVLEKLIDVLDTPTPQVSIEARIVEATSTFVRNLGFQWGFLGNADPYYGTQTNLVFPNSIQVNGAMIPRGQVTRGLAGPLGGYAINLPAPALSSAIGLSFANVLDSFRIDAAISALETKGEGRIISSPKVTAQNNQQAEIIQGRQIPVQTQANFTVSTRYVNAALELRATPQITAEGTIIMTIDIRNNAADFANLVNNIPPIITQSASTTVMIPDGGTTVIGGIYRTEDSYTQERVPLLHKIPILGNLFRSNARTKQNRELIIFITPRIVK